MKDLQRSTLKEELSGLQIIGESHLTDRTLYSVLSEDINFSVNTLLIYLSDCGKRLQINDLMDEPYIAETMDDVHDHIATLLSKYKRKMSNMNDAIGMTYTPPTKNSSMLSINTLLNIMDYFKCELYIINK